jgi:hypothetical protein
MLARRRMTVSSIRLTAPEFILPEVIKSDTWKMSPRNAVLVTNRFLVVSRLVKTKSKKDPETVFVSGSSAALCI